MHIERNARAHEFACDVGIDYAIAELTTKRIPKELRKLNSDGSVRQEDGDAKVYEFLLTVAARKNMGGRLPALSPTEEQEYLRDHNATETLDYLSYTAIHHLFLIYKIMEVMGNTFPEEINPKTFEVDEVDTLINWLF